MQGLGPGARRALAIRQSHHRARTMFLHPGTKFPDQRARHSRVHENGLAGNVVIAVAALRIERQAPDADDLHANDTGNSVIELFEDAGGRFEMRDLLREDQRTGHQGWHDYLQAIMMLLLLVAT